MRRAATTTSAPSSARVAAVCSPMPLLAPVTSATVPSSVRVRHLAIPRARTGRRERSDGAVRITLVGPAYPWRGGLPLLVTDLAHRLAAEATRCACRPGRRQGPARLLPTRPLTAPEAAVFPTEPAPLSWRNPLDGWRVGRRAAPSDLVVVVHYTTLQAPVLWRSRERPGAAPGSSRSARTPSRTSGGRGDRLLTDAADARDGRRGRAHRGRARGAGGR